MKKYITKTNGLILLFALLICIILYQFYILTTPTPSIIGTYGLSRNVQDEFITINHDMEYHRYKDGTLLESGTVRSIGRDDLVYDIISITGDVQGSFIVTEEKIYRYSDNGFWIYYKMPDGPVYINFSPWDI